MAIYSFRCNRCHSEYDEVIPASSAPSVGSVVRCKECGNNSSVRVISPFSFVGYRRFVRSVTPFGESTKGYEDFTEAFGVNVSSTKQADEVVKKFNARPK